LARKTGRYMAASAGGGQWVVVGGEGGGCDEGREEGAWGDDSGAQVRVGEVGKHVPAAGERGLGAGESLGGSTKPFSDGVGKGVSKQQQLFKGGAGRSPCLFALSLS